jgi:hypothetical protein
MLVYIESMMTLQMSNGSTDNVAVALADAFTVNQTVRKVKNDR